jgi:hypothetical protein
VQNTPLWRSNARKLALDISIHRYGTGTLSIQNPHRRADNDYQ